MAAIESGAARQLSVGFRSQIELVRGHDYDGVVRDLAVDHVALVPRGKAGDDCAIDADGGDWRRLPDAFVGLKLET